jgi:O-antigen ligase
MLALPFVQPYHRFPLTSFYSEWLAFALGLLAALLLLRRQSGSLATYPAVALAPLGLILLLGLQTALGRVPYPEQALVATLYLLWASLIIALGHRLGQELGLRSVADTLAWFVLVGGLLNALAGLIQHYDLTTPVGFLIARKEAAAVFGNVAQPNHFAAQIAMALASVAYLYGRGRFGISVAIACVAMLLLVSAFAGSRSPWLYFTAFAALSMLIRRIRRDDESRRLVTLTILLLPGFLVAQGVAILIAPAAGDQVTSMQRVFESASGVAARVQLWTDAWHMFLAAPFLGSGWGQFSWHHFLNQAATGPGAAPQLFNHAHNLALQLLAETGLVGFVIISGAAVAWLAGLRKVAIDADWWWMLALLSVIGIHSMLEYPLWYSIFLGPAALLLGLGTQHVLTVRFQGALRLTVLACILAGSLYLLGVLAPYREFERVVFSPESSSLARADERAFMAVISDVHREPLLTPYVELAIAHGVTVSRDSLPEKVDVTRRAMHFAPVSVVVYRYALLLALTGDRAAALRQLERAIRVYPGELGEVLRELRALAREHPEEITPLLELATAKSAEFGAPAAHR